jgi:hypothetical protein
VQLLQDVFHVELDGILAHPQPPGDLGVCGPLSHQFKDFTFTGRQVVRTWFANWGFGPSELTQDLACKHGSQTNFTTHHVVEESKELIRVKAFLQISGRPTLNRIRILG